MPGLGAPQGLVEAVLSVNSSWHDALAYVAAGNAIGPATGTIEPSSGVAVVSIAFTVAVLLAVVNAVAHAYVSGFTVVAYRDRHGGSGW